MRSRLPRLPALLLLVVFATRWAGGATDGSPLAATGSAANLAAPTTAEGEVILGNALEALKGYRSISARLILGLNLFGHQLGGQGIYLEQLGTRQMRMEVNLSHPDGASTFYQICDGNSFWTYRQIGKEQTLDLFQLDKIDAAYQRRKAATGEEPVDYWFTMAGMSRLLNNLKYNFQFGPAVVDQFSDLPVWRLEGTWRGERLAEANLIPKPPTPGGVQAGLDKLLPFIPHGIVLLLGKDDLVLRRLECWRRPPGTNRDVAPAEVLIYLQLLNVTKDAPIHASNFSYQPVYPNLTNHTQGFIKILGLPAE